MRKILFRAKGTFNGEWVEGYYEFGYDAETETPTHYMWVVNHTEKYGEMYMVIPETVGQYTGLTDKNGKKIFEGDICRNTKTGEIVSVVWHGTMAGYVWSRRKEGCKHLFDFGALFRCFDKYEVIGNIHDNPELMNGGE